MPVPIPARNPDWTDGLGILTAPAAGTELAFTVGNGVVPGGFWIFQFIISAEEANEFEVNTSSPYFVSLPALGQTELVVVDEYFGSPGDYSVKNVNVAAAGKRYSVVVNAWFIGQQVIGG